MASLGAFLHVRPGFESDASKELNFRLNGSVLDEKNHATKFIENSGFVTHEFSLDDFQNRRKQLKLKDLIFSRQLLWTSGAISVPSAGDRVTPITEAITKKLLPLANANAFSGFNIETPDADDSKGLSQFCKSISRPIENVLNKLKLLPKGKGASHLPRLVLVMTDSTTIYPCFADVENSSLWSMGIPRLKFPADAPSRSTLKLEEAFIVLLGQEQIGQSLKEGMTAVDMGACPGGWTYQLVHRGMHVTAVDNGQIDSKLMATGLVNHLQEDAFSYHPRQPVDWLVCDVVEQPSKISELMLQWFLKGWCKSAIFNLKLPMNLRWEECQKCLQEFKKSCDAAKIQINISAKQLYHDRKEITVLVTRVGV